MSAVIDTTLVDRARDGDRDALGLLLDSLRGPLHRLAVSMLWSREDAEAATQEALIAVMTILALFAVRPACPRVGASDRGAPLPPAAAVEGPGEDGHRCSWCRAKFEVGSRTARRGVVVSADTASAAS